MCSHGSNYNTLKEVNSTRYLHRDTLISNVVIVSDNHYPFLLLAKQAIATKTNKKIERHIGNQDGKFAMGTRITTVAAAAATV